MSQDLTDELELESGGHWDGSERRQWPRYRPEHMIPVLFRHPRQNGLGAGHIVDISEGGLRIQAPPTVTTPLRWGEPVAIMLSYSESTRAAQVEGMELTAVAVEVRSTSNAYELRVRFLEPLAAHWRELLEGLIRTAA